jgi:predicted nucleic acid-binding protein
VGTVAIDTSVVVALFDPDDAHHLDARRALEAATDAQTLYLLSVVVLAEALVGAARLGPGELARGKKTIYDALGGAVEVDERVAEAAAMLRAAHRWLRLPDALVLATAEVERADVVLTCDKRWAKVSPKVRVVGRAGPRPGRAG